MCCGPVGDHGAARTEHINVSEHNKTDETKREHGRPDDDSWLQPERLMEVQCANLKKEIEDKEVSIHFLKKQVERTDRSRYDICEVFSPPRVCVVAIDHGLRGGWSLDVSTRDPITGRCYDLRNPKDQKEVKKMLRRDCPTVVVVSPPCTAFSIANQGEVDPQTLAGAVEMVRLAMEVCELQHRAGRQFIFETTSVLEGLEP